MPLDNKGALFACLFLNKGTQKEKGQKGTTGEPSIILYHQTPETLNPKDSVLLITDHKALNNSTAQLLRLGAAPPRHHTSETKQGKRVYHPKPPKRPTF